MSSTFAAHDAEAYERLMGRWSRRLAEPLIRFGGLSDGDRVLDVGCGTGSLTVALPRVAQVGAVTGIDFAQVYVDHAASGNTDPRIAFRQGDATALPFEDATFDRAFALLVLQFIPDAPRAVAEMRRAVRPGGTVTAATWDNFGGMPHFRLLWSTAAVLFPDAIPPTQMFRRLDTQGEMEALWRQTGLLEVEQTNLLIRMEFENFEDYWQPLIRRDGPPGQFISTLSADEQERLRHHTRSGYLANRPDGPRSFAAVAWACRGTVPG